MQRRTSEIGLISQQRASRFTRGSALPFTSFRQAGAVMAILSLLLVSACGSDSPTDADGPKSLTIALSTASASIAQSGTLEFTASVTRLGGLVGVVDITVEDLPDGLTSAVTNVQTSNGVTTATVALSATAAAATGVHPVTVRGSTYGFTAATSLSLTVTPAP